MFRLSFLILCLCFATALSSQNPHGAALKIDCAACHSPAGWEIGADYWKTIELDNPKFSKTTGAPLPVDTSRFHHNKTDFPLQGRHAVADCRDCHETLVFSEAKSDCFTCHADIHQQTAGMDCARCHSANNWLVDNIQELHFDNGFPLTGVHTAISCGQCHVSESALQFGRNGNLCVDCHLNDFNTSTNPNHKEAGFSTDCLECHDLNTADWNTDKVDHSFFPLTKGHEINDCATCHVGGDFANTPNACFACHQPDFEAALSPNHVTANFSNDCAQCHTTDPDWMPAQYLAHDGQYFPIYSGKHQGVWSQCTECHTDPNNYAVNSCTVCHANPETDDGHGGVAGYVYENSACLACHPTGEADGAFDHNSTNFPLTGAHLTTDCIECHANGYAGTPTDCAACHTTDFNGATNPNHNTLGLSQDCASCHTTDPGWSPAKFDNHNDFYVLNGAHTTIANDCATCHNGDYNNTPNTCAGCHTPDFNQTTDPNHVANQFSTDCATCHSEAAWAPSTFDHNAVYPFTGAHVAIANDCVACHIGGNYSTTPNTCAGCHTPDFNQTTDPNHVANQFSTDCASCHSDNAWAPSTFDHNAVYPFTGAHVAIADDCIACHVGGNYTTTPNTCNGCHTPDFDQSQNPNHVALNLPNDCAMCHTTTPDWMPASFPIHDDFYVLNGAHAAIANDCAACHNGNYNNTPNTCNGCHTDDYNSTTNPNHAAAQFSTDCATCHSENTWVPATFDHDVQYFPIYSGAHNGEWDACVDCHTNPANYAEFTCTTCHANPETDNQHNGVGGYVYQNTACLACHPTGDADNIFDHNTTAFPLTGAHLSADCLECHATGFENTPTDCAACHTTDFNGSTNPNHVALGIPTDCASCHTTAPGWSPATFAIHNNYYILNGAHAAIANDCATCHNGDYNNTPNTCAGCHTPDFNSATDPNHVTNQFPQDCATCHSESAWAPSTFDHNSIYPFTGAHIPIANECAACHVGGNYTTTPNTCNGCHTPDFNQSQNPNHVALGIPTDCDMCHTTTPDWMPASFPIHDDFYVLNGAHAAIANDCAACHNGSYTNTPNTCNGCHNSEYVSTTNPNHAAAQFPTDCAGCHSENTWVPATFDHDGQYFPIYSGAHNGEWNACVDCHANPANYAEVVCTTCHANPETNNQHNGVNGYSYNSPACLACHPTGDATNVFDHNTTAFPLTGAHLTADCLECHAAGYAGTPTECSACHTTDFNGSTNPNHVALGLPMDCASCHTTDPGWAPATFAIHDDYYILNGAHIAIANDCAACHNGNYNSTPNTCNGCHNDDFNQTTDPNHSANQLPTDCQTCHSETAWVPSTFDHNAVYPFTGAHIPIANDCAACHVGGNYSTTPNTCNGCHTPDFNQSQNPNHVALGLPTDCDMCHTTTPDWMPAQFPIHDDFYVLNGAHAAIANDCAACHNGNYNNTPNTCNGCHNSDYVSTTNPNHAAAQFSTDCATCHSENTWVPATFDHDAQYFPIYSGAHDGEWNACVDCHTNPSNFAEFTCTTCHANPETNNQHNGVNGYSYNSPACLACHPTGNADDVFDHNSTAFPLTGAHLTADCLECHAGGYAGTPTDCAACHTTDFNGSTNPNHVVLGIPTDCASCHTTAPGWAPATFAIHDDYYALTGAHVAVANDCAACHNGNYNNTPNTCSGCHTPDFNGSTNPNHVTLGIPNDCDMCHTTQPDWEPAAFPIHNNYYALNGAHATIANDCAACHNGNYNNTPNTCNGCHNDDYAATTNPNHATAQFPTTCDDCHTETAWAPANFDHNAFYPLNGAHANIANDCAACHIGGNYTNTPNTCNGCHNDDYATTTDPNHVAAQLPTTCEDCHTETAWAPSTFDHSTFYPFTGAHIPIANDCAACHIGGNYTTTPNTCAGCHTPDFNSSTNPNHVALGIPNDCDMCHTTQPDWMPATFPIHNNYYVLNGAHATIANDCAACHNGNYNNTPNTCAGCHTPEYNSTTNPNHAAAQFPTTCEDCHTETAWAPANFDHNAFYPLNGAHAIIANDCAACHIGGNYSNTPNSCNGCHNDDYAATTNPNHATAQFPTTCDDCHTETAWSPSTFDHSAFYPFTGAHIPIANDCAACHIGGNYTTTPNTCAGCHTPDYTSSTNPNHVALGIPTDCDMCHTTQPDWMPATFPIHDDYYVLSGAHVAIANDCAACHNGNYNNTPNTCNGCHNDDYAATTNPNHAAAQFPITCDDCHTETAWAPANFNHNAFYPLNGAHATIANDCAACHIGGNYSNTPNTCNGCHNDDYNATTNPNHATAQFPTTCDDCHTETAWVPATFDHSVFYPFTGAHIPIANDCAACHIGGNYSTTPNTCAGCHTPDYNSSTNPNHVALGIPTDCDMCHTTDPDWDPATFPIHNNYYQLLGAHAAIANDCAACHNGNYNNTPNTCYGCHQSEYNNTNNPDHQSANFPTDCTACHSQNAWEPSTFDHDDMYFPIYSGKHEGEWNNCNECHTTPNNYSVFNCLNCHNNQNELEDDHEDVPNYQYNSAACYACHPEGED